VKLQLSKVEDAMADYFIGIDSGTQGTKAVVVDLGDARILAEGYASHQLIEDDSGKREQEPAWWISACESAIDIVLEKSDIPPGDVRAIGVSGQQHGFVPVDKKGLVIRPAKLWCDTATTAEAETMTNALGGPDRVVQMIGNSIAVGFTASKVKWLKEHEAENYDRLHKILLPHDYINYWLTGEQKCEYSDASGTAYFDVRSRAWSEDVLRAIDASGKLTDCLPDMIQSHEPVGTIRPEIARRFGFSRDVIVSSGGGDNMMAAIGTGNVAPGVVTASLGTSGTIYCFSEKPVVDSEGELAAFCSGDGYWLPLVCTMNVTVSTELTRSVLGLDVAALNENVVSSSPGAAGILLLPYFNGERTPALPKARATFFGLTSSNFTPENICRATMEGATFGLRYGLDVMRRNGIEATQIRLVGGGAKSQAWRQMVADIFSCPVACPITQEAGALGAAIQAIWCFMNHKQEQVQLKELTAKFVEIDESTRAEPKNETVAVYKEVYEKYLELNEALRTVY
jgi:D-xylulose kinase